MKREQKSAYAFVDVGHFTNGNRHHTSMAQPSSGIFLAINDFVALAWVRCETMLPYVADGVN